MNNKLIKRVSLTRNMAEKQTGRDDLLTGQNPVQEAGSPGVGFQLVELARIDLDCAAIKWPENTNRLLVFFQDRPVKWVKRSELQASSSPLDKALELILAGLLETGLENRAASPALQPETSPLISVVVCTRDRTDLLAGCLNSLIALSYPNYEILVIDNAPETDATERLCEKYPVKYIREARPGLDIARNTGWQLANGNLVAFTDDDARPDPGWLMGFFQAFQDPEVESVTGPVLPYELATPAQIAFEDEYGGMSHGFQTRYFQRDQLSQEQLLWASGFGVGANMAFRRNTLAELGGFDPCLDVGTPAAGGGDVDIFHRLVAEGHGLVYTPAAWVWHLHRRDWAGLRKQIYNNGRSFGVYLLTCWRNHSVSRGSIIRFATISWFGKWLVWRLIHPGDWPRSLVLVEMRGALSAPAAYRNSRKKRK